MSCEMLMTIDLFKENQSLVQGKRTDRILDQNPCSIILKLFQSKFFSCRRHPVIDPMARKYRFCASCYF